MPDNIQIEPLVVEMAIEPKSRAAQQKLELALAELSGEDSSFQVSVDRESGQIILKGTSEATLKASPMP
jgi:elongation factor G